MASPRDRECSDVGAQIDLAHHPVVLVVEAREQERLSAGRKLFEDAQLLEDFQGGRVQSPGARTDVIGWFLVNNADSLAATGEVKGLRQTHRSGSNDQDIRHLCSGHRVLFSFRFIPVGWLFDSRRALDLLREMLYSIANKLFYSEQTVLFLV